MTAAGRLQQPAASNLATMAAIAAGGAVGALARYGVGQAWPHPTGAFPWSTVLVNISGCLLIGVLMAWLSVRARHPLLRPFVGVGVLGGYTTFSSSMADSAMLVAAGRPGLGLLAAMATWALSLAAAFLGWRLTSAVLAGRSAA